MSQKPDPIFGVPQGDVIAETPDGINFARGDQVRNRAYDGNMEWPTTLVPGNFDLVAETGKKK